MEGYSDTVIKYYDRIIEIYNIYHSKEISDKDKLEIKECLKKIIDKNYGFLLTESMIDYIVHDEQPLDTLIEFSMEDTDRIHALTMYFRDILIQYQIAPYSSLSHSLARYTSLTDLELKLTVIKAGMRFNEIYKEYFEDNPNKQYYQKRAIDIENILLIILAYYIITKRNVDVSELIESLLGNPYQTAESLWLNGIDPAWIAGDDLIQYVLSRIEEKEIK